jgi:hypothetical protein
MSILDIKTVAAGGGSKLYFRVSFEFQYLL